MELTLPRSKLVRNEAVCQKNLRRVLLREKFKQWRAEIQETVNSRQRGTDSLSILPEEIWTMILGQVTDEDDIANCARTCQAFKNILDGLTNGNWLFGKVFPFLFNYLDKPTTLKCRPVSKRWCSTVDNFLQSYYAIDDKCSNDIENLTRHLEQPKVSYKPYEFEYKFKVPHISFGPHDRIRDDMSLHLKNPFIGRSVTVEPAFRSSPSEYQHRSFPKELPHFLNDFGEHIWHFSLSLSTANIYRYDSTYHFYSLCGDILSKCKNLRSLCLIGAKFEFESRRNEKPLPDHTFLESITIDMGDPFYSQYQDKLLEKYCTQLKRVDVAFWNCQLYHNFKWDSLLELRVEQELCNQLLNNLTHINAPNLREGNFCLDEEKPKFENLMRMINHFPKLDQLELQLSKTFCGWSDYEILLKKSPGLVCCTSLQTVELTVCKHDISCNFLICFPFLRKLTLHHDFNTPSSRKRHGCSVCYRARRKFLNEEEESVINVSEVMLPLYTKPQLRNDELQVSNNLNNSLGARKLKKQNQKSNIWEILTKLETVVVYNADINDGNGRTYSRKGYDMREMDYLQLLKLHWESAKKDAAHQIKLKSCTRQSVFANQRTSNAQIESTSSDIGNNLVTTDTFEKVFPLLFNKLSQKDVLNCRAVCKLWCFTVDSFLENYCSGIKDASKQQQMGQRFVYPHIDFDFVYKFEFPFAPAFSRSRTCAGNFWTEIKLRERNPFIGRTVEIQLNSKKNNYASLTTFLQHVGKFIWHVVLTSKKMKESVSVVSEEECRSACLAILKLCPNLRSLCTISDKFNEYYDYNESMWEEFKDELDLQTQRLPYFESLIDGANWELEYENFHKDCVTKYYRQLKRVHSNSWGGYEFEGFQWENLRELAMLVSRYDFGLQDLADLDAPKLANLCVLVDARDTKLKVLVQLTHNLKIPHLEIRLSERFAGFPTKEILNMTPGFTSSKSLESLELVIAPRESKISFDFLMYFPYLKKLCIRYAPLDIVRGCSYSSDDDSESEDNEQHAHNIEKAEKASHADFIQLEQFVCRDEEYGINATYNSNVWNLLPYLQILEVHFSESVTENGEVKKRKFYRRQNVP